MCHLESPFVFTFCLKSRDERFILRRIGRSVEEFRPSWRRFRGSVVRAFVGAVDTVHHRIAHQLQR